MAQRRTADHRRGRVVPVDPDDHRYVVGFGAPPDRNTRPPPRPSPHRRREQAVSASLNTPIHPRVRTIDGLAIRYAGSEPRDEHALLLSPWPESLYAFTPTWATLAEHAHLVAVDLPGFGHSARRDDRLSPRAMGNFLVHLADEFGLDRPHAVGPDVGTGALLFAAADHPGCFRTLVVGTGATSYPLELGEPLSTWVSAPDLEPYRRQDPRQIV